MVVPQFPRRADAKNAVCLAALAAGVGMYMRAISAALEAKVLLKTKTFVYESILPPPIKIEYAKFWPNKLPDMFEYTKIMMVRMIYLCCIVMSLTTGMRLLDIPSVQMHHNAQANRTTRRTREVFLDHTG